MSPILVDVLAFEADGVWYAQCVQHDIVARADSLPKLPQAIARQIAANAHINQKLGRKGLDGIPPAPADIRARFEQARMVVQTPDLTGARIETFKVAEAA